MRLTETQLRQIISEEVKRHDDSDIDVALEKLGCTTTLDEFRHVFKSVTKLLVNFEEAEATIGGSTALSRIMTQLYIIHKEGLTFEKSLKSLPALVDEYGIGGDDPLDDSQRIGSSKRHAPRAADRLSASADGEKRKWNSTRKAYMPSKQKRTAH